MLNSYGADPALVGMSRAAVKCTTGALSMSALLLRPMVTLASDGDQANMGDATKRVLERLARTRTNAEFLNNLTKDA